MKIYQFPALDKTSANITIHSLTEQRDKNKDNYGNGGISTQNNNMD